MAGGGRHGERADSLTMRTNAIRFSASTPHSFPKRRDAVQSCTSRDDMSRDCRPHGVRRAAAGQGRGRQRNAGSGGGRGVTRHRQCATRWGQKTTEKRYQMCNSKDRGTQSGKQPTHPAAAVICRKQQEACQEPPLPTLRHSGGSGGG
jgi:hypothetical protein